MAPVLTLCLLLPPLGITIYLFYRMVNSKSSADPVV